MLEGVKLAGFRILEEPDDRGNQFLEPGHPCVALAGFGTRRHKYFESNFVVCEIRDLRKL